MNITAAEITAHLQSMTAVELRKLGAKVGIKGASKGKKAELVAAIAEMRIAEAAKLAAKEAASVKPAKRSSKCTDCGRKEGFRGSELCDDCREYAEWENTHSDNGHENGEGEFAEGCPVCHPELDPRKGPVKTGRSRAGMVIVAKGTEIHKSETFRVAAEAAGWTVTVQSETYELPEGTTGEGTRYYATATKGESHIALAWDGRAYDYPESGASFHGKARKVRNLKEALRLL
jgi:Rho termination factor-like protein